MVPRSRQVRASQAWGRRAKLSRQERPDGKTLAAPRTLSPPVTESAPARERAPFCRVRWCGKVPALQAWGRRAKVSRQERPDGKTLARGPKTFVAGDGERARERARPFLPRPPLRQGSRVAEVRSRFRVALPRMRCAAWFRVPARFPRCRRGVAASPLRSRPRSRLRKSPASPSLPSRLSRPAPPSPSLRLPLPSAFLLPSWRHAPPFLPSRLPRFAAPKSHFFSLRKKLI